MEDMTIGEQLLTQLIADLGLEGLSTGVQQALAARFNQMYDAGFSSNNQLAAVLLGTAATKTALEAKGVTTIVEVGEAVGTAKEGVDEPVEITFALTANAENSNLEGQTQTYTLTASEAVTEDTTVTFKIVVGDAEAADQGTNSTNLNDFAAGSFNPVTAVIKAGETTATFNVTGANDSLTELPETYSVQAEVNGQTLNLAASMLDGAGTFTLTTGADAFSGTSGNDTFKAGVNVVVDPATGNTNNVDTLSALDTLTGGAGTDTLDIVNADGSVEFGTISGIEVATIKGIAGVTADSSAISDLNTLKVTGAGNGGVLDLKAAATTDVDVSMKAVGAAVGIEGGKDVNVALTNVKGATDIVNVGVGAEVDPAGAVTVSTTGAAYTAATVNTPLSAVNVTGGSSINVTSSAGDSSAAAADLTATTITQGNVTVIGNENTTDVTVTQDAAATAKNAAYTTGGITETASVKFGVLKQGDVLEVAGLTLKAAADMTADQVAAAFAELVNNAAAPAPASIAAGDTQSGASTAQGEYTLIANGWTSGAASGDTVVFTSTTANTNVGNLTPTLTNTSTNSVAPVVTTTAGKAHDADATGGVMGVVGGVVSVTDANGTIKTITLDGYGASSTTTTTSVLETLNISNSDQDLTVAAAAAGGLTVNAENIGTKAANGNITNGTLTLTVAPTTLNVASTGDNYVALTAAATTDLNVSGTGLLDVSANDLALLKNVVVTESAGLTLNAGVTNTLASVDTTGTTGTVTTSLDGVVGTYTGGAGVDNVTLSTSTALTKDIDLGAGDDTLSFAALNVTESTKTLSGGAGTDTLSMAVATAANLDGAAQSFYTNFERLTLNDKVDLGTADVTINLANLGFTNYVTTNGTDDSDIAANNKLILDKLDSNGTVVLGGTMDNNSAGIQVNVTDAATGTADVLNLAASVKSTDLNVGTLTAADVETVNINFEDTVADDNFDGDTTDAGDAPETISMVLTADKATTVNVTGSANANLTLTGSTKVATIDGSTMTGNLTVTNLNTTTATTIKGGSGSDVLNAGTGSNAVVLEGGAGNDVLVANKGLSTLTGGDGADVFHIAQASLTSSSYSTITDFTAEDVLQIAGATQFLSTEITQADTASFQDYANAAVNTLAANEVTWFQYGDNTYVVMDAGSNGVQFDNNEDFIVKLTGLVDLSGASFNETYNTIAL